MRQDLATGDTGEWAGRTARVVSLIGANNADSTAITLASMNSVNDQVWNDMARYEEFKITGVAVQIVPLPPTQYGHSISQVTCAYSDQNVIAGALGSNARVNDLMSLQTYQSP